MEWNTLQIDCPDSARKIWPWPSYRHHPHDGSWRSASCLQDIRLGKRSIAMVLGGLIFITSSGNLGQTCCCLPRGNGAAERCYSKSGRKGRALNAEGCPAQSSEHQAAAAAQCQLQGQLGSLEPAVYTLCLCKHCGIHLLPPADHSFCQRDFSDSSPCLYPHSHYMKVICSL